MRLCGFGVDRARLLRLEGFFAAIIGGDVLPVKKPDPGHLLGAVAAGAAKFEPAANSPEHRVATVAFVPSAELPQTLPVAIVITIAARIVATARLRSPLGPNPPGARTSPTQPFPPTRRR